MRIWLKQDTACFLESHAKFFEHLGNVYKLMVYDNTRVAVKKNLPVPKENQRKHCIIAILRF